MIVYKYVVHIQTNLLSFICEYGLQLTWICLRTLDFFFFFFFKGLLVRPKIKNNLKQSQVDRTYDLPSKINLYPGYKTAKLHQSPGFTLRPFQQSKKWKPSKTQQKKTCKNPQNTCNNLPKTMQQPTNTMQKPYKNLQKPRICHHFGLSWPPTRWRLASRVPQLLKPEMEAASSSRLTPQRGSPVVKENQGFQQGPVLFGGF